MASIKEYLDFVLEQLSGLDKVSFLLNKLLIVNKISHFLGDYGSYLNENILKFKVLSSLQASSHKIFPKYNSHSSVLHISQYTSLPKKNCIIG